MSPIPVSVERLNSMTSITVNETYLQVTPHRVILQAISKLAVNSRHYKQSSQLLPVSTGTIIATASSVSVDLASLNRIVQCHCQIPKQIIINKIEIFHKRIICKNSSTYSFKRYLQFPFNTRRRQFLPSIVVELYR